MCTPYAPDGWLNLAWVVTIHDVWSTEAAQAELVLWVAGEAEPSRLQGEDRAALLAWRQAQDGPVGAFKQKPTVSPCQKTVHGSMNLILISWMGFLIDFRPEIAF